MNALSEAANDETLGLFVTMAASCVLLVGSALRAGQSSKSFALHSIRHPFVELLDTKRCVEFSRWIPMQNTKIDSAVAMAHGNAR